MENLTKKGRGGGGGGGEKGGARFLPRRVAQSNYLGHATGINDKRIIFSLSVSNFYLIRDRDRVITRRCQVRLSYIGCRKGFEQQ